MTLPSQIIRPGRRAVGWLCGWLTPRLQKLVILLARELGILSISDTDAMIAERGLRSE